MRFIDSLSNLALPVFTLFVVLFTGIGVMLWLTPFPAEELTPAQTNLLTIADWMVKVSVGAIRWPKVTLITSSCL